MSLSEEIQMIAPSHLNFVLSILTNDLLQRSTECLAFFLSFRPEGSDTKRIHPQMWCQYYIAQRCRRDTRWRHLSLQILYMLTPSSNSNGLRIIFVFSRILAAQMKAEILSQLDNRRSFSKEAESSHHRQSSELELRSFWVDRTELIKFIHAAFSSSIICLSFITGTTPSVPIADGAKSLSIDDGLKLLLTNSNRLLHFPNAPHSWYLSCAAKKYSIDCSISPNSK